VRYAQYFFRIFGVMRSILSILIIGITCLSLPSCKKGCGGIILQSYVDSLATNTFTISNGKPTKLAEFNGSYTTYHYNSNSLIDTIANYDVTGLLISFQLYTYSGKQLTGEYVYSSANNTTGTALGLVSQYVYSYTGNNITQANETLYSIGDTTTYSIAYSYNSNGDVIQEEKAQTFQPSQAERLVYNRYYSYDNDHIPWGNLANYMQYFSANNVLTMQDSLTPANNITYSYQYNSNDYPTSITQITATGYTKTDQYSYCQ